MTVEDGRPVVKVIDFGIARAIDQPLHEKAAFTRLGVLIGTPEYMSPEQAAGDSGQTDTRSDVYALGVILYELLTGVTPHDRTQLLEAGYAQMMRTIREVDPPRPSTRFSRPGDGAAGVSALRRIEPRKLAKLLLGDLDVIVMKCLEKDRTRRYETASGLGQDVRRFLNDDPVEARPPSNLYLFGKFARKHRKTLAVAACVRDRGGVGAGDDQRGVLGSTGAGVEIAGQGNSRPGCPKRRPRTTPSRRANWQWRRRRRPRRPRPPPVGRNIALVSSVPARQWPRGISPTPQTCCAVVPIRCVIGNGSF